MIKYKYIKKDYVSKDLKIGEVGIYIKESDEFKNCLLIKFESVGYQHVLKSNLEKVK